MMQQRLRGIVLGVTLATGAAVSGGGVARADGALSQLSSAFPINPADPVASVPALARQNGNPLEFGYFIQDLAAFAVAAGNSGDHAAEARYYRAFAKAVPDDSVPFVRLCEALEADGKRQEAIAACRDALGREGVELKDYIRFVHLVLAKTGAAAGAGAGLITAEESEDVSQVIEHLRQTPETRVAGTVLQCELAMRKGDQALLRTCSDELQRTAPHDPASISFAWALAVRAGNEREARRLVGLAKATGVRPEGLAQMEQATDGLGWPGWLFGHRSSLGALVAAALMVVAALFVWRRRSLRQRLV